MKVRADVAELLRDGLSNREIARQLEVDAGTVAKARALLRMPKHKSGPRAAASPEDLFWRRTQPTDDDHLLWTGYVTGGTPALRHGGRVYTACRIAFRMQHGREPVGKVTAVCERDGCVHPRCVADRPMREANARADVAFAVIFGGQP